MEEKILIVDDEEINRSILGDSLCDEFEVDYASNGAEALKKLKNNFHDYITVILDLIMPEMDGFEVLKSMNDLEMIKEIPVIVITADQTEENERKCYEFGARDFIFKPFNLYTVRKKTENMANMSKNKRYLEEKINKQIQKMNFQYKMICTQNDRLKKTNRQIIDSLGTVVEYRHLESGEHIQRVKKLTKCLAERVKEDFPEYGLTDDYIEIIVAVSPLHDLGKIMVPDSILSKPAKLTESEYDIMKTHTTKGCEILNSISELWSEDIRKAGYEICRYHHEKYDGKGYPDGLVGDAIPLSAQIVSIADVYDALVSERTYKDAYDKNKAFYMILNGECGLFSPKLMESFRNSKKEFENIIYGK